MNYSLAKKPKKIGNGNSEEVWIALPQYDKIVGMKEFAELAAEGDSNLESYIKMAIPRIAKHLRNCLTMGYKVDLEELGTFFVKFDCKPLDVISQNADANEVNTDNSGNENEEISFQKYNPHIQVKDIIPTWEQGDKLKSLKNAEELRWHKVSGRRIQRRLKKANKNCDTTVIIKPAERR